MRNILWWLFIGCKGGMNRARIVNLINKKPINTQQISDQLNLNYKTVKYHLKLLEENNVIECTQGVKYGALFFITDKMKSHSDTFKEILEDMNLEE
jgi:predicted transcriptional regulator